MKPVTATPEDDCLPKFFRVHMPDISGDDMELPVSFNSYLPTPLPKYITLKSIYGKMWKMALRRCGGEVERYVLLNGWKQRRIHVTKWGVTCNRFNLYFSIFIIRTVRFCSNFGLGTQLMTHLDLVQLMTLLKCESGSATGWKRIAKDEFLNGGDVLEFEFDGSKCFNFCIYEPITMCKRLRRSSVQSDEETKDADDVLVLSNGDDDDDSEDADYNCADVILEDVAAADDDVCLDGSAADDMDDDDERQYLDDRSNAFFPVTINPKKISQLRIPSKVINDYGLNFSESITLIDPLVNKFGKLSKKIKIQMNGSVFLKGYGAVIRRNGVKSTDKMICELKKAGNNNLVHTIKFHVIK